jgi:hypothetical protein
MWRSDQSLTASRKRRLDDNAGETGHLDAALLFTCRIPRIVTNPSAFFATWTDIGSNRQTIPCWCSDKLTAPSALHFITKILGRIPFYLYLFTQNPHRIE